MLLSANRVWSAELEIPPNCVASYKEPQEKLTAYDNQPIAGEINKRLIDRYIGGQVLMGLCEGVEFGNGAKLGVVNAGVAGVRSDRVSAPSARPRLAKWYLAAGYFDQFVTYEGTVAFAELLQKNGTSVDWRPQWGDHCAVDVSSLVEIFVK